MSLIQLRLEAPPLETRSSAYAAEWLPPVTRDVFSARHGGGGTPGIVSACATRLSAALLAGGGPPEAVQLIPWAAWRLLRDGEALVVVRVRRGRPVLLPANLVSMTGHSEAPVYSLEVPGPDRSLVLDNLTLDSVAHLILTPDPARPWRGQSWLASAGMEGIVLSRLTARFSEEMLPPSGRVLTRLGGPGAAVPWFREFQDKVNTMRGGVAVTGDNLGQQTAQPVMFRLGPNVPESMVKLYESLNGAVANALGFPAQLVSVQTSGATARRDMLLTWTRSVLTGWTRAWSMEIGRVLDRDVSWDFTGSIPTDPLPARIRGAAALVKAGWSKSEAEQIAGL